MVIKLGKFIITSDSRSYQLEEITGVSEKTGQPTTRKHGYFMTLDGLLQKAFKVGLSNPEIQTLDGINTQVNKFITDVCQAFLK